MSFGHGDHCYAYRCSVREHTCHNRCYDRVGNKTCTQPEHNHAAAGCPRVKTCRHPD